MRFWVACTVDFLRFFACLLLLASVLHDASSARAAAAGTGPNPSKQAGWGAANPFCLQAAAREALIAALLVN